MLPAGLKNLWEDQELLPRPDRWTRKNVRRIWLSWWVGWSPLDTTWTSWEIPSVSPHREPFWNLGFLSIHSPWKCIHIFSLTMTKEQSPRVESWSCFFLVAAPVTSSPEVISAAWVSSSLRRSSRLTPSFFRSPSTCAIGLAWRRTRHRCCRRWESNLLFHCSEMASILLSESIFWRRRLCLWMWRCFVYFIA